MQTDTTDKTVAGKGHRKARRGECLLDRIDQTLTLAGVAVALIRLGYHAGYDDATNDLASADNADADSPS